MFKALIILFIFTLSIMGGNYLYAANKSKAKNHFVPRSFEAELLQIVKKRISKKTREEKVLVKYLFPKNIKMELENLVYTCNATTTWNYQPPYIKGAKGELVIGKSSKHCFSKIFDAISTGFRDNKLYKVETSGNKEARFVFTDKAQKSLNLKSIQFIFKEKMKEEPNLLDVQSMILHHIDRSKKSTTLKIVKIDTAKKLKSSDFIFQAPKNTNIEYLK